MGSKNVALNVLVDAKTEYTKQLLDLLTPRVYEGISSLYDDAKQSTMDPNKVLIAFQQQLSQIPKWTSDILDGEYQRIQAKSQCDWIEDLITVVFISHAKVLTSVKFNGLETKRALNLNLPNGSQFIHKCYIQAAREFWKNPLLCYDCNLNNLDIQRNLREAHSLIRESIEEMVRKLLPVKTILQEYLGTTMEADPDNDISSNLSQAGRRNLKKMIEHEMSQADGLEDTPGRVISDNLVAGLEEQGISLGKQIINGDQDKLDEGYSNYKLEKSKEIEDNGEHGNGNGDTTDVIKLNNGGVLEEEIVREDGVLQGDSQINIAKPSHDPLLDDDNGYQSDREDNDPGGVNRYGERVVDGDGDDVDNNGRSIEGVEELVQDEGKKDPTTNDLVEKVSTNTQKLNPERPSSQGRPHEIKSIEIIDGPTPTPAKKDNNEPIPTRISPSTGGRKTSSEVAFGQVPMLSGAAKVADYISEHSRVDSKISSNAFIDILNSQRPGASSDTSSSSSQGISEIYADAPRYADPIRSGNPSGYADQIGYAESGTSANPSRYTNSSRASSHRNQRFNYAFLE